MQVKLTWVKSAQVIGLQGRLYPVKMTPSKVNTIRFDAGKVVTQVKSTQVIQLQGRLYTVKITPCKVNTVNFSAGKVNPGKVCIGNTITGKALHRKKKPLVKLTPSDLMQVKLTQVKSAQVEIIVGKV